MANTFDNASRLTGITQGTAGVSFGYDAAGRRTSLTLPNGIVVGYSYDQGSQLTGLTYSLSGNTLGNLGYVYDQDGRRIQLGGSWARTGIPNATTSAAVYNVANELTSWNGATLAYDANGNMTSDALFASRMDLRGGTNTYTWDSRNQLSGISGVVTGSFVYDPFGRRQGKTINTASTNFLYDGLNPIQELSGTTVNANLLTGGVDEYFTRTDALGTSNFLSDALGSTVALADTTGTVQTSYTYQPFGGTTTQGSANGNSYQFTGRENDGTGLYFYRARYYSPTFGRFISEDPAGFEGGINLHAYVSDSPPNLVDPSGRLAPPYHWWDTYDAARAAGYSPEAAAALADKVVAVDAGTQGKDPSDANTHAMAGRKQTCEGAYSSTANQLQNDFDTGNLAKAVHTVEDAPDPAHMFRPWDGGYTPFHLPGISHGRQDWFPSDSTQAAAILAARRVIQDWQNHSLVNPVDYLPADPCK